MEKQPLRFRFTDLKKRTIIQRLTGLQSRHTKSYTSYAFKSEFQ